MPGPAPDKNARRRNARPDWRQLPAEGRAGDPPDFPLGRPSKGALALWADLWATPQADAWEKLGWTRVVARYSKLLLLAERASATGAQMAEARQIEDRLGLSPMAMRRLQWEIAEDQSASDEEDDEGDVTSLDAYRTRAAG